MAGRAEWAIVAGASVAALVHDPLALAAAPKTVVLVVVAVVALGLGLVRSVCSARSARTPGEAPRLARRDESRAPSPSVALWLLLCAWSALTLVWGNRAALAGLAGWCGAAGLMLQVGQLGAQARVEIVRLAAVLAGSGSALVALGQRLVGEHGIAVHGGQGNPNWLGLVLAVALPLSVDAVLEASRRRRWLLLGGCLVQLGGLLLSGSRVAWIALALVALVAAVRGRRRRWWLALAAAAGLLLTLWVAGRGEKALGQAWAGRLQIWAATVGAAAPAQPFGVGLGRFGEAYLVEQGRALAALTPGQAARRFLNATTSHSEWFQVGLEQGLVGLLLLGLCLVSAARASWRRWPGGSLALISLMLAAAGDSPLQQPAVLALLALLLPAADAADHIARWPRMVRVGHLLALAVLALLLLPAVARWIGSHQLAVARDQVLHHRLATLHRAAAIDPWSGEVALEHGLALAELGRPKPALAELQRSRARLANVGTDVAIGNVLLALGRREPAVRAYRRALARHPGFFRAHANLAEALRQLGRLERAGHHLRVARSLLPGHPKLGDLERRLERSKLGRAVGAPPD